ncbi:secreted protein, partial [sediment metagenome]
ESTVIVAVTGLGVAFAAVATVGAVLAAVTVTLTPADVVTAPALSVAFAVSE